MSAFAGRVTEFSGLEVRPTRAFRCNLPALDLFPTTLWAQLSARRLRRATTALLLGVPATGYRPLQEAVTDYLRTSRGVNCRPEQVAIVSGVQEALDLVARLCIDPGDRVCIEDPGYPGAALVFEAYGAKLTPVRLDDEGMTIPGPRLAPVRLAYLTPGHQFPVGISMSLQRRLALLDWAHRTGALVLEDDYDSEYRYAGRPMPAMQGLDRHGVVCFAGSFSKVLFPSLRLGYLVVPPDLVDLVAAAQSISSRHAPLVQQALLCDFITEGHFGRHIRRMREMYAERREVRARLRETPADRAARDRGGRGRTADRGLADGGNRRRSGRPGGGPARGRGDTAQPLQPRHPGARGAAPRIRGGGSAGDPAWRRRPCRGPGRGTSPERAIPDDAPLIHTTPPRRRPLPACPA